MPSSSLLIVADVQNISPIFTLAEGFREPSFASKALICTIQDAAHQNGFFISSICSDDCTVVYKATSAAGRTGGLVIVLASSDPSLTPALLMHKVDRLRDAFSFALGEGWASTAPKLLRAALGGLAPFLKHYVGDSADSLEFCTGLPAVVTDESKVSEFPRMLTIGRPAKPPAVNPLEISAIFVGDALFSATQAWTDLLDPHDVFCVAQYLARMPSAAQRTLPCYLRFDEKGLVDSPVAAALGDRKNAKRMLIIRIVPRVNAVVLARTKEQSLVETAAALRKAFASPATVSALRAAAASGNSRLVARLKFDTELVMCFTYVSFSLKRVLHFFKGAGAVGSQRGVNRASLEHLAETFRRFRNDAGSELLGGGDSFENSTDQLDRCLDFAVKTEDTIFYACVDTKGCLFAAIPPSVPFGTEGKIARNLLKHLEAVVIP